MNKTIKIYEKLYKDYEKNKPLGIDYPTEALVILSLIYFLSIEKIILFSIM